MKIKKRTYWIALFVLGILVILLPDTTQAILSRQPTLEKSEDPYNIILITISSLRADHIGCLGYDKNTTPNFDSFAKQNILFKNTFATSSWMMPAYGSIITSLYPGTHGATHINKTLSHKNITLAEILARNGFHCAGFCCNPRLSREKGFDQGFHLYDDYSAEIIMETLAPENRTSFDINKTRTNDLINDAVISWLKNNTAYPFFLFVHYYDNHWDYLPPHPYDKTYDPNYQGPIDGTNISNEPLYSNPPAQEDLQHIIALYDGEIKQTDKDLGELLEFLKQTGLMHNSIIIVVADHGEQFYEHGHTSHHGIYDELIHIPMAIAVPEKNQTPRVINSLASQLDLLPTILDYLKLPIPEHCRGKSLRPLISGRQNRLRDFIFAEYTGGAAPDCYALRTNAYKLIKQNGKNFAYLLKNDPLEQHRIPFDQCPEKIKPLKSELEKIMNRITGKTHFKTDPPEDSK